MKILTKSLKFIGIVVLLVACYMVTMKYWLWRIENENVRHTQSPAFSPVIVKYGSYDNFVCRYSDIKNLPRSYKVSFIPDARHGICRVPDERTYDKLEKSLFSGKEVRLLYCTYDSWIGKDGTQVRLKFNHGSLTTQYSVRGSSVKFGECRLAPRVGEVLTSIIYGVISTIVLGLSMIILPGIWRRRRSSAQIKQVVSGANRD